MADRDSKRTSSPAGESEHVAEPNERMTDEQRQAREAIAKDGGRIQGGPRSADGGSQGHARDLRSEPSTTGVGSDMADFGQEASGGDVIDTRRPEAQRNKEGRQSPERLRDRASD